MTPSHQDRFAHNTIYYLVTLVIFLATRLFVPPIVLAYVPLEEYGIWAYAFILISYIGMSAFGITNVYVRYVAVYYAHNDLQAINRLLTTGIAVVSLISICMIPILWFLMPILLQWLHVSSVHQDLAFNLLFGTAVIFCIELSIGAFSYVLQGIHRIALERVLSTLSYFIETVAIFIFLWLGYGIYSMLYAFIIKTAVAITMHAIACKKLIPTLSLKPAYFDSSMLNLFYHFGGIVQLSGILGMFNRSFEKLLAGLSMGASATALYELGEKFPITATNFPGAFNVVMLPASSHLHATEQQSELIRLYMQGSRYLNLLAGYLMGFLWGWAAPLIVAWLGTSQEYTQAINIVVFFCLAYQMDTLTGPASALYRSTNHPIQELYYAVAYLSFSMIGAAIGFAIFGTSFEAINWGVATGMVIAAAVYIIYSNRWFKANQLEYFFEVLLPGLIPYVIALLIVGLLQPAAASRKDAFLELFEGLAVYTAAFSLLTFFILLTKSERRWLLRHVGQ